MCSLASWSTSDRSTFDGKSSAGPSGDATCTRSADPSSGSATARGSSRALSQRTSPALGTLVGRQLIIHRDRPIRQRAQYDIERLAKTKYDMEYSPVLGLPRERVIDRNLMRGDHLAANNYVHRRSSDIANRLSTYNAPGGGSASVEYCVIVLVLPDPRGLCNVPYYAASPGWTNGVGGAYNVTYSPPSHAPYNFTGSFLGAQAPNPTPAGIAYPPNLQTPLYSAYPGATLGGYATNICTNSATAGQYWQGQLEFAAGANFETPAYSSAYPGAPVGGGRATNIWANGATAGEWQGQPESAAGTNFEVARCHAAAAQSLPTENGVLGPQVNFKTPNQIRPTQGVHSSMQSANPTMPEPNGQQFVPPRNGSKPSNIINRLLCVVIVLLSIIIFKLM